MSLVVEVFWEILPTSSKISEIFLSQVSSDIGLFNANYQVCEVLLIPYF
jgi:hypothetical protein